MKGKSYVSFLSKNRGGGGLLFYQQFSRDDRIYICAPPHETLLKFGSVHKQYKYRGGLQYFSSATLFQQKVVLCHFLRSRHADSHDIVTLSFIVSDRGE